MENRLKIIGLTGGSGTGKSSVMEYLVTKGMVAIDCDQLAREVVAPNTPGLLEICEAFGSDILQGDGSLDRKKMGNLVFRDQSLLFRLENIIHKYIDQRIAEIIAQHREVPVLADGQTCGVILIEAIKLFESGLNRLCDKVVVVLSSPAARLARIAARDTLSEEDASDRIQAQKDDDFFISHADYVIYNNADLSALYQQADDIFAAILAL